jgi:Methyltransferase domain
MEMKSPSELFDAYYYAHDCGEPYLRNETWMNQFALFADRIASTIQPGSVLDAGCAWGFLVEALHQRNIEAWGVDISEYAIQNVHPDYRPYCRVGSITEPFDHPHYDLIVCIEVLEHMQKPEAEEAVANFCNHTDDILFSSTPYNYKEATHFNVQPPEYWAECFARHSFFRDVDFDASFITPWAVRFQRKDPTILRLVRDYERHLMPLWKENVDLRTLAFQTRNQLDLYEARISALEQENQTLRQENQSLQTDLQKLTGQVAETDRNLVETRARLQDILNSRRYKLAQLLPKPPKRLNK